MHRNNVDTVCSPVCSAPLQSYYVIKLSYDFLKYIFEKWSFIIAVYYNYYLYITMHIISSFYLLLTQMSIHNL